jgi:UDP-GlcNAc:undecaprenyl-phosphate GlcNAc-1-phosphate transferase
MTPSRVGAEPKPVDAAAGLGCFPLWASIALLALAGVFLVFPGQFGWQPVYGARWAHILVVSGLISFGLTPLVIRMAYALGILDVPASRKVHSAPTPLLGGLAIYVAFILAILANSILDRQVVAILLGATLLVLVGVVDDIVEVPATVKMLAQLVAAGAVIGSGVVLTLFPQTRFGDALDIGLTVIWLLGITNAMNFSDGMDGLATGLSIITASFLGLFAFLTSQPFLGWFASAVVGSCLGFLPFNFRRKAPAAIFLGDAGSTFLGFVLAALAVKGEWAENSLVDLAAPVLIFWVFIYDMTHITAARILTGKVRSFHDWIANRTRPSASRLASSWEAIATPSLGFSYPSAWVAAIALVHARALEAALLILQAVFVAFIFAVLEHAGDR